MSETRPQFSVGGIPLQALLALLAITLSIGGGYAGQRYAAGQQWGRIEQNAAENAEMRRQLERHQAEMQSIRDNSISKAEFDRLMKQLDRMERDTQEIRGWILSRSRN
jgi:hypothetical protein